MIFVFIAGSYTPFALLALPSEKGWVLFWIVWGGAIAGVLLKMFWPSAPRWVGVPLYLTGRYEGFLFDLGKLGIRILSTAELTLEEKRYFGAYLAEEVAPRTDVLRADAVRNMRSQALYFASGAAAPSSLIRMPEAIPRLLDVPGRPGTYVRLGDLLRLRPDLFRTGKDTRLHELRVIRLTGADQRDQ